MSDRVKVKFDKDAPSPLSTEILRELQLKLALESFPNDDERLGALRKILCLHCGEMGATNCQCWNDE